MYRNRIIIVFIVLAMVSMACALSGSPSSPTAVPATAVPVQEEPAATKAPEASLTALRIGLEGRSGQGCDHPD